jgi:predicted NBD/HSP70 family sugar kinase
MRSGTNLPAVGGYNRAVILDAIRRAGDGISRVEVAQRTGLSAQTASNVCRRLVDEGFIRETGTVSAGVGKPRRILELRPDGRFAIGIHLDPSVITVVLVNLAGDVVDHRSISTPAFALVERIIDRIVATVEDLIDSSGVGAEYVLGAGVAAPGPIDVTRGTLVNPPQLPNWNQVPIRDVLTARLGLPVVLEKDVTAAAIAETWSAEPGGSFAFFYYGTGIGVGFALRNEVVRGSSGNAGGVASMRVRTGGTRPATGPERIGDATLPRKVVDRAIERGILPELLAPIDNAVIQDAFLRLAAQATAGDGRARAIIDDIAEDIADVVIPVVNLLDVDRVIFGGPFWTPISALLLQRIPRLVRDSPHLVLPHPITFTEAAAGDDVAAVGAACLVFDRELSPVPAMLLISAKRA